MTVKVFIADDQALLRGGLKAMLETHDDIEVVGEAEDGASAITQCCALRPEVVLLDVQLPDTDGFRVCAQLMGYDAHPKVILTSSRDSSDFGPLVSTSGARGFVPKAELSGERVQELL